MADVDYRRLARGIKIAAAALIDDPAAFAANGERVGLAEISGEQSGFEWHVDRRIVAEGGLDARYALLNLPSRVVAVLRPYSREKAW